VSGRVLELNSPGFYPQTAELDPPAVVNLLGDVGRLADAVASHNPAEASAILDEAARRLQNVMMDELHRLVGTMVVEISLATSPRARLGRAIAGAARLLESRPSDTLAARCADPHAFAEACQAATEALILFTSAALNEAVVEAGGEPRADLGSWLRDAARELHSATSDIESERMDRKVDLSLSLARTLQLPPEAAG
jgi:hypothetical protein